MSNNQGRWLSSLLIFCLGFLCLAIHHQHHRRHYLVSPALIHQCKSIHKSAGKSDQYDPSTRSVSDRFVPGTPPVFIRNAKILTGNRNGTEVFGDILLDKGVVQAIGYVPPALLANDNLTQIDAGGRWISPGLVDLHSHLGVNSIPSLTGSKDGNSRHQPINPFLRSVDGLNTHDESYALSISGGVTIAQVLPGSANNIGGQAVLIKLRPTAERSVSAMVLEPPRTLFINSTEDIDYIPWRHMKHACGENPDRLYSQSRMDAAWNFRHAYDEARTLLEKQNAVCEKVEKRLTEGRSWKDMMFHKSLEDPLPQFPVDLELEALVDVLRGRVKLSIHCYESVDLDGIVRLSNEFQFPIASFHHAGETYLVPDLLKKTWGGTPAAAIFAANARKKREAYRGSEFAARILADSGIPVIMKSDHPVLNSRYLMYEAQAAHYYGLNSGLSIASVTSTPANVAGVGWRVGKLEKDFWILGFDADLVIWNSHPLALGATPTQVYIDGIPQISDPHSLSMPAAFQLPPQTPNWDREIADTIKWDGLPPLDINKKVRNIRLVGVKSFWDIELQDERAVKTLFDEGKDPSQQSQNWTVLIEDGRISCYEPESKFSSSRCRCCSAFFKSSGDFETLDLESGTLSPGLTTFGSPIGLVEIRLEPTTNDGSVQDPLKVPVPDILGQETIIRAADGLQFGGRNTLQVFFLQSIVLAYRGGVSKAITAPTGTGFLQGLSAAFDVGARHALGDGAIVQEVTALHVTVSLELSPSVSSQMAALRRQLLGRSDGGKYWEKVRSGSLPLVVQVNSADVMASLIQLKHEVEGKINSTLQFTFAGGAEAPLLAGEIAKARISVILSPPRPFPTTWESQRITPGPPLTQNSQITALLRAGVHVAIGTNNEYDAKNLRFDVAWAALESNGTIGKDEALALGSINVERALGLRRSTRSRDVFIYSRGDFTSMNSKIIGVVSPSRGYVEFFG
ncbi:hypothetical protein D9757_008881 [Collybiopsis confluens]|uniref:Amidohydrolase-related domain-containing protein n=1 Tax=Collybiopsis confluens TaxID=2823264 RepID=A0A8H5M157_9AGAR|nr:hypothetical protein D9757_008881 [Collybiopsis confluens]